MERSDSKSKNNRISITTEEGGIEIDRIVTNAVNSVEEVICCICHKVLLNPVCCSACETHFCQVCINSWKKKKNECPYHCKLVEKKASKVVNSILSKLNVKCRFTENGCIKVDLYESLLKHEKSCQYMKVTCKFCNKSVDSKLKHEQECIDYLKHQVQMLRSEREENIVNSTGCKTNRNNGMKMQIGIGKMNLAKSVIQLSNKKEKNEDIDPIYPSEVLSENEEDNPMSLLNQNKRENNNNIEGNEIRKLNFKNFNNLNIVDENSNNQTDEKFEPVITEFKEWLVANSVNLGKIEIIHKENEYLIFAKQNINEGEEIVSIPRKLLICPENVKIPDGLDISDLMKTVNMNENLILLTLFLLKEKIENNSTSPYAPFMKMLPDDYFSKGIFFDDYEVHWLRGSMLFEETRGKREDVNKFYNAINSHIDCSYDDFCWSFSNANTKMVTLKVKNLFSSFLVPLVNCLEIDLPHNNQTKLDYDINSDCLVLKANKKILKNRRIFLSIGNMSNHQLLLNHGLIFENNPDDEVEVNMFFNDFDPLINIRRSILRNSDEPFVFKLKSNFSIENIGLFLAFLRIVEASNKDELKYDLNYYINNCVNLANEKKVMKKLEIIFKSRLNNYDTKCDQDEKLLKSDLLTANQKNCLMIRVGEKKIVSKFITFASTIQKLLDKQVFLKEVYKLPEFRTYLKTIDSLKL